MSGSIERGGAVLGDRLEVLYAAHAAESVRFAYLLVGDAELAQDLAHEAFVRCGRRLAHLRNSDAFPAYLRRTIANLAKMHFRRSGVEQAFLRRSSGPAAQHHDPDLGARDEMRVALLQLSIRQRTALVLRFYEDMPDVEIAAVLECAPATVRSLIARGLTRLRVLAEEG